MSTTRGIDDNDEKLSRSQRTPISPRDWNLIHDSKSNFERFLDEFPSGNSKFRSVVDDDGFARIINRFDDSSIDKQITLEKEINELKGKLRKSFNELDEVTSDKEKRIEELRALKEELQSKEKINHILPRICEDARQRLLSDSNFRDLFQDAKSCESVVVSIDIRRSTELMLKARRPELFAKFITELSQKLSDVILLNYGVFDKFTGDGILAFFPKFYSGEHAVVRALKAANECHQIFNDHYRNSRECFNVFVKEVGLGIGIDFGTVTLVNTRNELTVVGIPVVYACRMGGANAGETLLNQPAKEEISRLCKNYIKVIETEIDIKNEGIAMAYIVEVHESSFDVPKPEWATEVVKESGAKRKNGTS
jgi:class 3 adenylate cyclase